MGPKCLCFLYSPIFSNSFFVVSVERTTEEVIKDFVELSGTKGDVPDSSRTQIADLLRPLVHELYIATTEVRLGRSK